MIFHDEHVISYGGPAAALRLAAPVGVVAVNDDDRGTRAYIFGLTQGELQLYW